MATESSSARSREYLAGGLGRRVPRGLTRKRNGGQGRPLNEERNDERTKMSPVALAILLLACGVILLLAEVILPTHGVLGVIGVAALLAVVGVCFFIDQYV